MKHMCDLSKKDFEKISEKVTIIVSNPRYICKKCLRVANVDERLCKPHKLKP